MTKSSLNRKLTTLVLGLVVAGVVLAGAGAAMAAGPAPSGGRVQAPPEITEKMNTIWDNRIEMIRSHLECVETMDEIRHKVQELRGAGATVPPETREAIKTARESIRASKDAIRATLDEIGAQWAAAAEDRKAGDWAAVADHLDSIIDLQGTALEEGDSIHSQLIVILDLLDELG